MGLLYVQLILSHLTASYLDQDLGFDSSLDFPFHNSQPVLVGFAGILEGHCHVARSSSASPLIFLTDGLSHIFFMHPVMYSSIYDELAMSCYSKTSRNYDTSPAVPHSRGSFPGMLSLV
ncbi:hypothetical protein GOODEAATRI_011409 [Goodea atripinnis]|uniref:Uncharacterized protein n=1 Tax=Goodea atripinnis TaxID=208336 RepID=A0ABV0PXM8_9TELE